MDHAKSLFMILISLKLHTTKLGEVASVGNGQVLLRYLGEVSEDSLRQNFSTVCLGQVRMGIEVCGGNGAVEE